MASTDDFTFSGGEQDKRLRAMYDALPDFEDSDAISVVAGVLFLDQAAGKAERLHHVLIQPALAPWLLQLVRIDDAKIRELVAAADAEDVTDEQLDALDAQLTRKTFWTVSAWTSRDHLRRFDRANPHRADVQAIKPKMEPSTFVFWSGTAGDLPVAWDEVERRIAERRARGTAAAPSAAAPADDPDAQGRAEP